MNYDGQIVAVTHDYFWENGIYARRNVETNQVQYWVDNQWGTLPIIKLVRLYNLARLAA